MCSIPKNPGARPPDDSFKTFSKTSFPPRLAFSAIAQQRVSATGGLLSKLPPTPFTAIPLSKWQHTSFVPSRKKEEIFIKNQLFRNFISKLPEK